MPVGQRNLVRIEIVGIKTEEDNLIEFHHVLIEIFHSVLFYV